MLTLAACAQEPKTPASAARTDTAVPEAEAPVPPPASAPAPPQSKIGLMALLEPLPPGSRCTVDASGLEARFTVQGEEVPARVIRSASGDSARTRANFLEVVVSRPIAGGADEVETIYVNFGAEGRIETGTRQYYTSGSNPVRESGRLLASDSAAARALVQQVLERCRPRP
jgi:hypothetical protein